MKRNEVLFSIAVVCALGIVEYTAIISTSYQSVAYIALLTIICLSAFFKVVNHFYPNDSGKEFNDLSEKLQNSIQKLSEMQEQLVVQEKMASIGMLTAGIAHEIKNPLNFINNFSDMTVEILQELKVEISRLPESTPKETIEAINTIIDDIATNCQKINEHGKRAESIIKNMLIQSRSVSDEKTPYNVNALLDEYLNLAYHGMRAQNNKFNVKIEKHLDPTLSTVTISPQSMGRVFLNIINNALYAVNEKTESLNGSHTDYMPTLTVVTSQNSSDIIVKIRDNGNGIPESLQKKIFEPFFTTKPPGKGTGLGLPICYDIVVKEHDGKLEILSVPKEFTEFILTIPKDKQ